MISSQVLENLLRMRFVIVKEGTTHFIVCCPFCQRRGNTPDTKFKLYISKEQTGAGYRSGLRCFRCDFIGAITALFPSLAPTNARDLWKMALQTNGSSVTAIEPIPKDVIPCNDLPDTHLVKRYLHTRRITESNFLFCYSYERRREDGRIMSFGPRIIIPVICEQRYCGFQGRAYGDRPPKYVNAVGFQKSQALYGWDNVMEDNDLVIVEGVFDTYGFYFGQAVAAFGKELSQKQQQLILSKQFKRIIIMFDQDAGIQSKKTAQLLAKYRSNVYWANKLPWKDPGSVSQWENMNFISQGPSIWRNSGLQKI